jgi:KDO2-lipid IV(A) lauroyltransferase
MRKILRALKQKESVVVLLDQNMDWYEGVFVDFFGKSACTNQGLALMALTTEAPVIPVFLVRDGQRFITEFLEEIPLVRTGDRRKDLEENTQRYTQTLEAVVRRFPGQWLWVHQRWKTRPCHPWPRETCFGDKSHS